MICRSPRRAKSVASGSPLRNRLQFRRRPARSSPRAIGVARHALGRGDDYHRSRVERREHPRRRVHPEPAVEHHARQRPAAMDVARGQQRIVDENGFRIRRRWRRPRRARAWACRCDSSELMRVRSPGFAAMRLSRLVAAFMMTNGRCFVLYVKYGAVQSQRALPPGADRHVDALLPQELESAAADPRIGVCRRRDDACDAGRGYPFDARARCGRHGSRARACNTATRRARDRRLRRARELLRADRRRARDTPAPQSSRPRGPRPRRPSDSGWSSRARARRDRARGSCSRCRTAFTRNVKRRSDPIYHFVSNSASTYSSTSNGIRSSMDSPTPT